MACYVILRSVPSQKHIIFASFCIGFMPNELSCASRISHAVLRGHFRPRPGEIDSPGITMLPRQHHKAPGEGSSIPTRLSLAFFLFCTSGFSGLLLPGPQDFFPGTLTNFSPWDPYKLFWACTPTNFFRAPLGGKFLTYTNFLLGFIGLQT